MSTLKRLSTMLALSASLVGCGDFIPDIGLAQTTPKEQWGGISPQLYLAMGDGGAPEFLREAPEHGPISGVTSFVRIREDASINLPYRKIDPDDYDVTLVIQFAWKGEGCDQQGVFGDILSGSLDDELTALAEQIREDGRLITLRPMPEFNGFWTPTCAYAKGNAPEDFVPAFRHVVDLFRLVAPDQIAAISLNYNRQSAVPRADGKGIAWDQSDFARLYPGDEYVDIIEISTYDRCLDDRERAEEKGQEWRKKPQPFAEKFRPPYEAALQFGKPIGIAEIATLGRCDTSKIGFYEAMANGILGEFDQVSRITFLLQDVVESDQNQMCLAGESRPGESVRRNILDWSLDEFEQVQFADLMTRFLHARALGLTALPEK